ncbi:MAG: carbonic anhydrase family protein [Alphaproteobacteria bacterium]|nr:MAG: carbonic anhydrase family protein [Alphaproteobacteria bacterium]
MLRTQALGAFAGLSALVVAAAAPALADDNWSYGGAGPASWGGTCAVGTMQSPIDIEGTEPALMHRLDMQYQVAPLALFNDRHGIRMDYPGGSFLVVGNKRYQLAGFHFHTPSEHSVMDAIFPMEIHFDHVAADGSVATVAVLVRAGAANPAAEEIWPNLPLEPDQNTSRPDIKINARDLMPNDKSYYRYMGSMTTPPCAEGVNWYVLKAPVEFSEQQIGALKGITGDTARPRAARNNRIILDAQTQ